MRTQHRKCFDLVCIHMRRNCVFRFRMVMEGRRSTSCQTVIDFVVPVLNLTIVPPTATSLSGRSRLL